MPVAVRIFHPGPPPDRRPLEGWLHSAKTSLAVRQATGFARAGADDVQVVPGPAAPQSFGARVRDVARGLNGFDGLVLLGSGALALATPADLRRFVDAARMPGSALANNRYSADVVAIGGPGVLQGLPDLRSDNALPRWLQEIGGSRVADVRSSWRLGVDLDSPADVVLTGLHRSAGFEPPAGIDLQPLLTRMRSFRAAAVDSAAEVLVAGRTSPRTLGWLEKRATARVRGLVEERGLRAGADAARSTKGAAAKAARPPASVLGALLDHVGPEGFGATLARLADAAVVDTRVLLAHRLGRDEAAWPIAEDRFASDLLLPDRVEDPWLRSLTASAAAAPIPVLLGGHTLVGPGLRLVLRRAKPGTQGGRRPPRLSPARRPER
jgi:hypothetical protein